MPNDIQDPFNVGAANFAQLELDAQAELELAAFEFNLDLGGQYWWVTAIENVNTNLYEFIVRSSGSYIDLVAVDAMLNQGAGKLQTNAELQNYTNNANIQFNPVVNGRQYVQIPLAPPLHYYSILSFARMSKTQYQYMNDNGFLNNETIVGGKPQSFNTVDI